ncbi:hypothetical protein HDV57DRAFT_490023 [Trichoderma longibrachiatum]
MNVWSHWTLAVPILVQNLVHLVCIQAINNLIPSSRRWSAGHSQFLFLRKGVNMYYPFYSACGSFAAHHGSLGCLGSHLQQGSYFTQEHMGLGQHEHRRQ